MEPGVYVRHERLKKFPPAQLVYIIYRRLIEHGLSATYLWIMDKLVRRVKGFSPPQISEVIPGLYVGGQQTKRGLPQMRDLGITAVVNLREESDDAPRGVTMDHYLWLPTTDDAAPTLDDLERGNRFIDAQLSAGRGVYVHCTAGVGRSPTQAAAYLVHKGMTPEKAWATVYGGRPFIRPTPPQIEVINTYAAHVAQRLSSTPKENAEMIFSGNMAIDESTAV